MDISGDWVTRSVRELPADAALRGARNARLTLLAGFTTVRDVGAGGFADISLMKAIDAGMVIGPRMIPSAHAIGITGGHCDETGWAPGVNELSWKEGVADGVDEVVKAVRYQIKHGAKVIKVCATAGVLVIRRHPRRPAAERRGAAGHRAGGTPPRVEGRGSRPRDRRYQGGSASGRRFDRARLDDRRRGDQT